MISVDDFRYGHFQTASVIGLIFDIVLIDGIFDWSDNKQQESRV